MSVWDTILVFILTEPRGLSSGERCHSLLSIWVTHSAWSHLSLACVWLGNPTSKHISVCVFVGCSLRLWGQFFFSCFFFLLLKQMHTFNLSLIDGAWSSRLSRKAHSAVGPSQTTTELCSRHRSKLYPKLSTVKVCTPLPLCTYLIIPINVRRVCATGSQWSWCTDDKFRSDFYRTTMTGGD